MNHLEYNRLIPNFETAIIKTTPMSQSLCNLLVHCVFHKSAASAVIRHEHQAALNQYILGICSHLQCHCLIANGPGDHEHLLIAVSPNIALASILKEVKRLSTIFLKEKDAEYYHHFHWQSGYGAFSVSAKHKDAVYQYIHNQVEHHQKQNTEDEFWTLINNAKISNYQKQYYWIED